MAAGGRPPKIGEEHGEILRAIVAERPTATLAEIAADLKRRVGIDAHAATIRKTLREAGIGRVRGEQRAQRVERPAREGYGYSEAHRRWEPDQRYPSCLTDAQWALVEDLFEREGREAAPSAAVLDAQSTRGSPQGGPSGFDAGKKVKGRKRSLVVDTLGLLLAVSVGAANLQDRDAGLPAVARAAEKYPEVATLFVDSAYAGACAQRIEHDHGIRVEVVRHPGNRTVGRWIDAVQPDLFEIRANADGFVPLPKRWVVERTHAWNERARRLIMHHDVRTDVSETWVWLTEARILLRRLTTEVAEA